MFALDQQFFSLQPVTTQVDELTPGTTGLAPLFWWLSGLGIVILCAAVVMIVRWKLQRQHKVPKALQYIVLQVLVPKETASPQEQQRDWRETLAGFETLFVTLGGLKMRDGNAFQTAWNHFWFGRHDHLAFEIVAHNGLIHFYIAVPREVQQLVELQIQAQYPQAHIEEVRDYNLFTAKSFIRATTLRLSKPSYFSIRSYKRLDSDPLSALTNVLSKVQAQEGAAIQIVLRPKPTGWQYRGKKIAQRMQEGKKIGEASGGLGGNFLTASLKSSNDRDYYRGVPNITPMDQELIRSLEEKAGKPGFDVNVRIVTSSPLERNAQVHLDNVVNAFTQYLAPESGNQFKRSSVSHGGQTITDFIYRYFRADQAMILNSEEINSIYHFPLPSTATPNIQWLTAKKAAAPVTMPSEGVTLGHNIFRGQDTVVRLKTTDRRRHVYVIGTTGVGKSYLMANMALQDIREGQGVCVVDPHGSLVEDILARLPSERLHDVVIFDPSDTDRPIGLNMLEARTPDERDMAVQEMIAIFMKLFPPEMIGPMFEHNMRNAMLTLMEDEQHPGTIADIPRMFTDKAYQQYKVSKVKDPVVRAFWEKEMAKTSDFHKSEMLGYLISKVGRFVENAQMRNIIGQPKSGFNLRHIMDEKKILLVNLSKGKIGEVNASLLGLIIVSKLQMAALSRADVAEDQRNDFYLYIDEFQNFITDSIAVILSEARKYKLNLTMAHQYMGQLVQGNDTRVRDAVLGNVGTMVAFRIGVEDAEILEKQFSPTFTAHDLVNQEKYTAYVRLLIDNAAAPAFHMQTYPLHQGQATVAEAVKQYSRLRYGKDRATVEAEILERTKLGSPATMPPAPPAEASR